mmetsp:Transcript_85935/g.221228  ORF Transcript_85935/g.221228 Transcript_85935/m.221228 type:complete len:221 (+) Transcript_85935:79-741(+)
MASNQNLQTRVIGAAVNDPKVQSAVQGAARDAANDPRVQQAAYSAATDAATTAARTGIQKAGQGFVEVRTYVQANHCGVKVICFCTALALAVSSILGMINVFNAVFKPHQYLWAMYNLLFAVAIVIMDGNPEWFRVMCDAQNKLFSSAPILATQRGRAMFYFYVGSINLVMLPDSFLWKVVYLGIGAALCGSGTLMMIHSCGYGGGGHRNLDEAERSAHV